MTEASPTPKFPAVSIARANALLTAPGSMFETEAGVVNGVPMTLWKHAPASLAHIYAAGAAWGAREHLVLDDERVTFAGMRAAVSRLAAQLIADGVRKGDRVAIVMRNLPEWPVAFWACVLVGAIATPLNAWWTGPELEYGLADSGAAILICDVERWERVREHASACAGLRKIYVARAEDEIADPSVALLERVIGKPNAWAGQGEAPFEACACAPDDAMSIFYTSGTTGKPKGAVLTHRNVISNLFNALYSTARMYVRRGETPPGLDPTAPQRSVLISVPFFHATGCLAVLVPAIVGGAKLVMQRRWEVDAALGLIERERINAAGGVPTIAWQLFSHPRFAEFDTSSLEEVGYGGAPAAPELVRLLKERAPKSNPRQGWGMTETAATAVQHTGEDYENRPWSCGLAPPTGALRIVAPDGAEVAAGVVGEIWYKGPVVAAGYWMNPEATAATFHEGWVRTGDLGRVDDEGFLEIVDRTKDMLIRGGENIYCVEVENVLHEHEAVMDVALVGRAHPSLGEEPIAVVCLKPGAEASAQGLRHFAAQKLAAFKAPVDVIFWPEPLPRNANGKIVKSALKALLKERGLG